MCNPARFDKYKDVHGLQEKEKPVRRDFTQPNQDKRLGWLEFSPDMGIWILSTDFRTFFTMLVLSIWFFIKLISCYFLFIFPLDKVVMLPDRVTNALITLGKVKDTECFVSSLFLTLADLHLPLFSVHR